jgi:NAD(P)-dependent dehydrogenase (short-subunit alcohol dehydrogenase family)
MQKKIVITGANRGIGLALAQNYFEQGDCIIAVCRKASAAINTVATQIIEGVDVGDEGAVERLSQHLAGTKIDILINNAGVLSPDAFGEIDYDRAMLQFSVNALGPLRITEALSGCLQAGSKVALITSRMGSITDNSSGRSYGYRMSKAALNAAGMSLHRDLSPRKIAVGIFHPGYVQTDMVAGRGDITAQQCAQRLQQRIAELDLNSSGQFMHSNGELLLW